MQLAASAHVTWSVGTLEIPEVRFPRALTLPALRRPNAERCRQNGAIRFQRLSTYWSHVEMRTAASRAALPGAPHAVPGGDPRAAGAAVRDGHTAVTPVTVKGLNAPIRTRAAEGQKYEAPPTRACPPETRFQPGDMQPGRKEVEKGRSYEWKRTESWGSSDTVIRQSGL